MISFWEKSALLEYDYIIIGGGLMGMHIAYELREKYPHAQIVILERGILPSGASTKNAGFACFGSLSEVVHDMNTIGIDAALHIVEKRYQGIALLKDRIGDSFMEYENHGGSELLFEKDIHLLDRVDEVNHLMKTIFPKNPYVVNHQKLINEGFNISVIKGLIYSPFEGQIHSGAMVKRFLQLLRQKDIQILTGAEVRNVEENNVIVHHSVLQTDITFKAHQHIFITSNAFASQFAQATELKPGRGQILLTKPIDTLPFQGVYHMDEGYYYFRNVGNRILLGGARNMDFTGETTFSMQTTEPIIQHLKQIVQEVIIPHTQVEIEMQWAGIMGFTSTKEPYVAKQNVYSTVAMSCNGMGVALSGIVAKETIAAL